MIFNRNNEIKDYFCNEIDILLYNSKLRTKIPTKA